MDTFTSPAGSKLESFDFQQFKFGETPTDHLFLAKYKNGEWISKGVQPFSNLSLSPLSLCFHYGQTIFEGMKAFRLANGQVSIFRPEKHYERLSKSLERMCMPPLPKEIFLAGLADLVAEDHAWIPKDRDDIALYIRPIVIATEARIGVKAANEYLFVVMCTPIGHYYHQPLNVKIETNYVRATAGGAGFAKCGGNYGGSFYATIQANNEGYDQVIWTDAKTHQYLEEAGTMNIMYYGNGVLCTPPLSDSILDGITRDSLLQIASSLGIPVEERPIAIDEVITALESGKKVELFGVGTAASVSPIASVHIKGKTYQTYLGEDALMFKLHRLLDDIRRGRTASLKHWNYLID